MSRVYRLYKNLIKQSAVDVVTSPDVLENEHDLDFPSEYPAGESLQDTDGFPEKDFFRPKKIEGKDDNDKSAILALIPESKIAKEIADSVSDFDVDSDDLHITLIYIGKKLSDEAAAELVEAITPFCEAFDPLNCRLQGLGLFDHENEDGDKPFYASVDAIGMAEFRSGLVQALEDANIDYAKDYDFIPHMTFAYTKPENISFAEGSPGAEWISDRVYLLNGDDKIEVELGGSTKTAGGFGVNLTELTTPSVGGDFNDNPADNHQTENLSEDPDLKLGDIQDECDVEAPYSSGNGPLNVRFDDDKHYDIVKGAADYLGQQQDTILTPEFRKFIFQMVNMGFDLSTRAKALDLLSMNAKGFSKIISRLNDTQWNEIYASLLQSAGLDDGVNLSDPNEINPKLIGKNLIQYLQNLQSRGIDISTLSSVLSTAMYDNDHTIYQELQQLSDADYIKMLSMVPQQARTSMRQIIAQISDDALKLLQTLFELGFTVWNQADAVKILSSIPNQPGASELISIPQTSWKDVMNAMLPQAPVKQPAKPSAPVVNVPNDMKDWQEREPVVKPSYAAPLSSTNPLPHNKKKLLSELANQYNTILKNLPPEVTKVGWQESLKVPIKDQDGKSSAGRGAVAKGGMFVRNNDLKQSGMVVGSDGGKQLYVIVFPTTELVTWDTENEDILLSKDQVKEIDVGEKDAVALPEGPVLNENKYNDYGRLDESIPRPVENEDILYR